VYGVVSIPVVPSLFLNSIQVASYEIDVFDAYWHCSTPAGYLAVYLVLRLRRRPEVVKEHVFTTGLKEVDDRIYSFGEDLLSPHHDHRDYFSVEHSGH